MTFDSVIEDAGKQLGVRFSLVGVLPTAVLALGILSLHWSGAPAQAPDFAAAIARAETLGLGGTTTLVLGTLVFGLLTHPLQLALVRLFEGYWGDGPFGRDLAAFGIDLQRRHRSELERQSRTARQPEELSASERAAMGAAGHALLRRFPREGRLLPTALGNVLRAAEDRAGARYGMDSVLLWPRLFPLLPAPMVEMLNDRRNQLDLAVRMSATFVLAAVVCVGYLHRHNVWMLLPAGLLVLAWFSYRSAISSALGYGELIESAFDLHRFDLLAALHLPLPQNREQELGANEALCQFLRQGKPANFIYEHDAPPTHGA